MTPQLTPKQFDILQHTSNTGRYVGLDGDLTFLSNEGLLLDYGPQVLAGGDHYYTLTAKGRYAINCYAANLPKPEKASKRRRKSRQFQAWQDYCSANGRHSFPEFLKLLKTDWKLADLFKTHYT